MRKALIPVIVISTFILFSPITKTFAQDGVNDLNTTPSSYTTLPTNTTTTTTQDVTDVQTTEFTGRVTKIDNRTLTVVSGNTTKQVDVPTSIKITKNNATAQFSDIKVDDQVTLKLNGNEVVEINDLSQNLADISQLIVPAIIVVLILLILGYFLMRSMNKPKIKTTTMTTS